MNNNIMIFKNDNFGEIRSLEINNEPWFVGNEIANILGYKNGSRDINRHVDEEDRAVVPIRYFRSK
jgi:prophage antirepressor-like protein